MQSASKNLWIKLGLQSEYIIHTRMSLTADDASESALHEHWQSNRNSLYATSLFPR